MGELVFGKRFSWLEALVIGVGSGLIVHGYWLLAIALVVACAIITAVRETASDQSS